MRRRLILIAAATLGFTGLVTSGLVTIGVEGQWTYGLYQEEARPLYQNLWISILTAAVLVAVVWAGCTRLPRARRLERVGWVAGLALAGLLQLGGLVLVSRAGQAEPSLVHFADNSGGFFNDAVRLRREQDVLPRFHEFFDRLSLHGRAHPPGPVVLNRWALRTFERHPEAALRLNNRAIAAGIDLGEFRDLSTRLRREGHPAPPEVLEQDLAACHVVAWFILLFAVSAVIPIYLLGASLGDRTVGFAAAALYLVIPSISFFEPTMDLFYPVFTAWALWCVSRGFSSDLGRRTAGWLAGAGVLLGAGLFFSYCQLAVFPIVAARGLIELRRRGWASIGRLMACGAAMAAGTAAFALALYATNRYDMIADYFSRPVTQAWNWPAWVGMKPEGYARPYGVWLVMNLVEYSAFVGIPLIVGLAWAAARGFRRKDPDPFSAMAAALAAGLLLVNLTGVNRSETARIWIFMMPATAVAAAGILARTPGSAAACTALVWVQALAFKLTLTTNNIIN